MNGSDSNSFLANPSFAIKAAFFASLAVIVTSLLSVKDVLRPFGKLQDGLMTPIVAFEFVFNDQEVYSIFSNGEGIESSMVAAMRSLLHADFLFMASYSLLVVFLFLQVFFQQGKKLFLLGVLLGFFMWMADARENILLLNILDALPEGSQQHINQLIWVTWLKWGAFPFAFMLLAFAWRENKKLARTMWVVAVASLSLSGVAIFQRSIVNELVWGMTIVGFTLMVFYSIRQFLKLTKSDS